MLSHPQGAGLGRTAPRWSPGSLISSPSLIWIPCHCRLQHLTRMTTGRRGLSSEGRSDALYRALICSEVSFSQSLRHPRPCWSAWHVKLAQWAVPGHFSLRTGRWTLPGKMKWRRGDECRVTNRGLSQPVLC